MPRFIYKQCDLNSCGSAALLHAGAELDYQLLAYDALVRPGAIECYRRKFPHPINLVRLMMESQRDLETISSTRSARSLPVLQLIYEEYRKPFNLHRSPICQLWHLEACVYQSTQYNERGERKRMGGSWPSSITCVAKNMGFKIDVGIFDTPFTRALEAQYPFELFSLGQQAYPHLALLAQTSSPDSVSPLSIWRHKFIPLYRSAPPVSENERCICLFSSAHWLVLRPDGTFMDPATGTNDPVDMENISLFIKISR